MKTKIFSVFLAIFLILSLSCTASSAFKLVRPSSNPLTLALRLSPNKIYLLVFMDGPGFRGLEKPETVKVLFWDSKNDLVVIDPSLTSENFSIEILLKEWEGSLDVYLSGDLGTTWKHVIVSPTGDYQLPIKEDKQRPSLAPTYSRRRTSKWGEIKNAN